MDDKSASCDERIMREEHKLSDIACNTKRSGDKKHKIDTQTNEKHHHTLMSIVVLTLVVAGTERVSTLCLVVEDVVSR